MRQEYHYGTIVEHVPELFGDKAPNSCTLFLPAASTGRHKSQLATMHSVTPNALFPHAEGEGERWSQSRIPINAPHRQFSRERTIMRLLPRGKTYTYTREATLEVVQIRSLKTTTLCFALQKKPDKSGTGNVASRLG